MAERHVDYAQIASLPIAERIELAQQLWEDIHAEMEAVSFTPEQLTELKRRIADADAGKLEVIPADEVFRRLNDLHE